MEEYFEYMLTKEMFSWAAIGILCIVFVIICIIESIIEKIKKKRRSKKMRLIDADALEKELCNTCGSCDIEKSNIKCQVVKIIKDMPTIEAKPVVHGVWTDEMVSKGAFVCSECLNISGWRYDFCQHCGADMRGE